VIPREKIFSANFKVVKTSNRPKRKRAIVNPVLLESDPEKPAKKLDTKTTEFESVSSSSESQDVNSKVQYPLWFD
jgi:hypothetical protein